MMRRSRVAIKQCVMSAAAANQIHAVLHRFNRFVAQWRGARWPKMALKVFRLPDGEVGLRKPYLMPTDAEVAAIVYQVRNRASRSSLARIAA